MTMVHPTMSDRSETPETPSICGLLSVLSLEVDSSLPDSSVEVRFRTSKSETKIKGFGDEANSEGEEDSDSSIRDPDSPISRFRQDQKEEHATDPPLPLFPSPSMLGEQLHPTLLPRTGSDDTFHSRIPLNCTQSPLQSVVSKEIEDARNSVSLLSNSTLSRPGVQDIQRILIDAVERKKLGHPPSPECAVQDVLAYAERQLEHEEYIRDKLVETNSYVGGDTMTTYSQHADAEVNCIAIASAAHCDPTSPSNTDLEEEESWNRPSSSVQQNIEGLTSEETRIGMGAFQPRHSDEKKESLTDEDPDPVRRARFATDQGDENSHFEDLRILKSLSMTESDVDSLDGLPSTLQSRYKESHVPIANILQRLDGFDSKDSSNPTNSATKSIIEEPPNISYNPRLLQEKLKMAEPDPEPQPATSTMGWPWNLFFGTETDTTGPDRGGTKRMSWKDADDTLGLLGCAAVRHREERPPAVASSLIRVLSDPPLPSYAEAIHSTKADPRMQAWVEAQQTPQEKPPSDGSYYLGKSRTVIVHEIVRGNWTWCTAWSPNGDQLAVATENHHLAVIDTTASTVWRVRHDQRINGPFKNDTTHSIRAIAWGLHFIAIGGTGNAVSILSPKEPFLVLHTIRCTGFVGSLDWKVDSNILAIASRLGKDPEDTFVNPPLRPARLTSSYL
jgi:hypothetical protein